MLRTVFVCQAACDTEPGGASACGSTMSATGMPSATDTTYSSSRPYGLAPVQREVAVGRETWRTFAEAAGIEPTFVRTLPMVPLTRYPQALAASGMDIGLVPLTDIPFNRAKSFLKGMEYAAAGIIPVAQGLPEYQRLAETGVGRVAHTAEDWTAQLEILVKMGRRARTRLARADRRNLISAHDMSQREQAWKAAITDW